MRAKLTRGANFILITILKTMTQRAVLISQLEEELKRQWKYCAVFTDALYKMSLEDLLTLKSNLK